MGDGSSRRWAGSGAGVLRALPGHEQAPASAAPPEGSVALVFTDVQGSTRLWERCGAGMRAALEVHDRVLRSLLAGSAGYEVKTQGDSFMIAFPSVQEALGWCLEAQDVLLRAPWPVDILSQPEAAEEMGPGGLLFRGLRVRMGVHVGEPECRVDARSGRTDYLGRMVNVAARVAAAGHGGQVLVSGGAWAQAAQALEPLGRPAVRPLGAFRLKGIDDAVALVEVLPAHLSERRFGVPRAPRDRQGNVPVLQEGLVGRVLELGLLRRWLSDGARLVTLLGPGGMGKTRLATSFGALERESGAWEGGVWLCELAEAQTAEALCLSVGQALGIPLRADGDPTEPVERLGRALNDCGDVLLILDNLEQAVQHVPATLGRWLQLAPRARFLATSREALGLLAERVLDLAPLSVPEEGESRLEALVRSDAVRLFTQRAREARGHFELTEGEAPLVADIVRQLDGIALAIELAAARMSLLSVSQLRERLPRRFELLRAGRRDGHTRQATLRAAIDWSWNLLEPEERAALARCSVFRGGFTLEAAEAVLGLPPEGPSVLDVLQSLRARSLLRLLEAELPGGDVRLGQYESIRQYAAARLAEAGPHGGVGDAAALAERHADWYLTLAHGLRAQVRSHGGAEALQRLALERENLLAACDNALAVRPATSRSVARALEALVALEPEVVTRGPVRLLLERLDAALAMTDRVGVAHRLVAEAVAVRGRVFLEAGDLASARRDLERARESLRTLGAVAGEKRVLVDLSIVARHEGELAQAWALVREARRLSSEGDRWLDAYTVGNLGLVEQARCGPEAAIPHLRAAQALFHGVGDVTFEVGFLSNCAVAIGELGRTREAMGLLEDAMARSASVGDRAGHALARLNLGCCLLEEGRPRDAREHLLAAARIGRQLGQRLLEGTALGELGRAELALGAWSEAWARLSEAVSGLGRVSRGQVLRFAVYRAVVEACVGDAAAAEASFVVLEGAPELRENPVLRELAALLRASVDLAEARAAGDDVARAQRAFASVRQRIARARGAPPEAASSDLRGALGFLEEALWRLTAAPVEVEAVAVEGGSPPACAGAA
ncbi:ATP-binding protein [Corallococcus macrosporus]|uniref:Cyclase n=1 Tax=Corallococcus macrosporus DSM 14697 TaxID=1189310 RepID=A0A250K4J0_9BACT|nr:adenylate/guanylate cyclase domain-containing protein [Corallococcus macrosporus]ATB50246.1 cyclase [Corallococcus macrosporus DSM 14697]